MKMLAVSLISVSSVAFGADITSYHIGNSLTWDMLCGGLPTMPAAHGDSLSVGYHIRSSAYLDYTVNNPSDTSITPPAPYGNFANALPNYHWNDVTIQPYKGWPNGSTLGTDIAAVNSFMTLTHSNPANSDTRFFIYAAWPDISLASSDPTQYQSQWLRSSTKVSSQATILSRDYFLDLYSSLHDAGTDIRMIPAGEVLFAIDQKMRNGEIPGFTSVSALYRDDYHLNDLGRHVVACTAYATMFDQDPTGMAYTSTTTPATSAQLAALESTAWNVVVANGSYTGVPEPTSAVVIGIFGLPMIIGRRRRSA